MACDGYFLGQALARFAGIRENRISGSRGGRQHRSKQDSIGGTTCWKKTTGLSKAEVKLPMVQEVKTCHKREQKKIVTNDNLGSNENMRKRESRQANGKEKFPPGIELKGSKKDNLQIKTGTTSKVRKAKTTDITSDNQCYLYCIN